MEGQVMSADNTTYPLSIRFWYHVHDTAERLWHWTYRAKIKPWFDAQHRAEIPPTFHLVKTIPATPEEQALGITEKRLYTNARPLR